MEWVLFFDGDCAFCSRSVRQVARWDRRGNVSFAPLQGALARENGFSHYAEDGGGSMVLLRESDGKIFTYSDSWIELFRALGGFWRVFSLARWVPRGLRDAIYRLIARNRYRLVGKSAACAVPDPVLLSRLRE